MCILEMIKLQAKAGRKFFTLDNLQEWDTTFEDQPNELGIFIISTTKSYDWEPKDDEGKTYCVKIFRLSDSSIDGVLYKERNFGSLTDAKRMKDNLTCVLLETKKGFDKGIYDTVQDVITTPELMTFISPDKESVTLDLDELGRP